MQNCPDITFLVGDGVGHVVSHRTVMESIMRSVMGLVMRSVSPCHEVFRIAHLSEILKGHLSHHHTMYTAAKKGCDFQIEANNL